MVNFHRFRQKACRAHFFDKHALQALNRYDNGLSDE